MDKQDNRKSKRYKYAYLNDFKLDESNNYTYQGIRYKCDLDDVDRKHISNKMFLLEIFMLILVCVSGFLPFKGMMGYFYVIIPYATCFIFIVLLIPCIYKMYKVDVLKEYEYSKSIERIEPYSIIALISSVVCLINALFYCIKYGFEPIKYSMGFIVCFFLLVLAIYSVLRIKKTKTYSSVHTEKNNQTNERKM